MVSRYLQYHNGQVLLGLTTGVLRHQHHSTTPITITINIIGAATAELEK